jgi:hypothetical protein
MKSHLFIGVLSVFSLCLPIRADKYTDLRDVVVERQAKAKEDFEASNPNKSYVWKFVGFKYFPDCDGRTVASSGDVLRGLYKSIGCSEGGYQEKGIKVVNKDTYEADGKITVYIGIVSWAQSEDNNNPTKVYRLWQYEYNIAEETWYQWDDPLRTVKCRLVKKNKTISGSGSVGSGANKAKGNFKYSGEVEEEECSCGGGGNNSGGGILDWLFGK